MDSLNAECVVLGCVLLSNSVWDQASVLREQDFSLRAHQLIFRRMRDLAESGHPIDMVTLAEELGRQSELESIRGVEYRTLCPHRAGSCDPASRRKNGRSNAATGG
jgi:replicative DNA helicase